MGIEHVFLYLITNILLPTIYVKYEPVNESDAFVVSKYAASVQTMVTCPMLRNVHVTVWSQKCFGNNLEINNVSVVIANW